MSLFDITGDGSTPQPVPVDASNDGGTSNWLGDASVLNNIALGWASLFTNPTATVTPTAGGTYVVQPTNQPAPVASISGSSLNLSSNGALLLIGGVVIVALVVLLK